MPPRREINAAQLRRLHAQGLSNRQIANALGEDNKTVGRRLEELGLEKWFEKHSATPSALIRKCEICKHDFNPVQPSQIYCSKLCLSRSQAPPSTEARRRYRKEFEQRHPNYFQAKKRESYRRKKTESSLNEFGSVVMNLSSGGIKKTCVFCGNVIVGKSQKKKYCSPLCAGRAFRKRRKHLLDEQ